jgi:hypothetical protein
MASGSSFFMVNYKVEGLSGLPRQRSDAPDIKQAAVTLSNSFLGRETGNAPEPGP